MRSRYGRLDADAVVADGEAPGIAFALSREVHPRRLLASELDRVGDQVLEELAELGGVSGYFRQWIVADLGVALVDRRAEVGQDVAEHAARCRPAEIDATAADARVGQQVVDQCLHPPRAVDRVADVAVGALVELATVAAREELGVADDHPQRLLEVVRGDVGELLELGVRTR